MISIGFRIPWDLYSCINKFAYVSTFFVFLYYYYYYFLKKNINPMQICIRKQKCRRHVQNLHAAQTITRTPNQKVNRNMLSAIKDVDPPMEI